MGKTQSAGNRGEAAVARYLRQKGYTLLASQWRCRFGELDLVAQDRRGTLCIVEVKLRGVGSIALPREFVDSRKQQNIIRAAKAYIAQECLMEMGYDFRFDVAEVLTSEEKTYFRYTEDAFRLSE